MNQDVERLWELQTVLSALNDRENQLSTKPESFAAVDREWETANAEMEKLRQQIEVLSKERRRFAVGFANALEGVLAELAMDKTRFEVRFGEPASEAQWSAEGVDSVVEAAL